MLPAAPSQWLKFHGRVREAMMALACVIAAASPLAAIFAGSLATHPSKNACAVVSVARTRVVVGAVVGSVVGAGGVVDAAPRVVLVELGVVVVVAVVVGNGGNVTLVAWFPPESPQPYASSSAAPTTHNIERLA